MQVAAERALSRVEDFDGVDGLVNWMVTVGWREAQAQWRRAARAVPGNVPDRASGHDPVRVVEGRMAIAAAVARLAKLNDSDRQAVLASLNKSDETEPLSAAEKMRPHRARRRLAGDLAGWIEPQTPAGRDG